MKEKVKVTEIIAVEGKDDTRRIQGVVTADTIEMIGSVINDEVLTQIEHVQETRGVIIFTDPDYSGEKIHKTIMEVVPDAKHVFLSRKVAVPKKNGGSLGVEHASGEATIEVSEKVVIPVQVDEDYQEIPRRALVEYGLITGANAKKYCELLGDDLRIGYINSKQLVEWLNMLRIVEVELKESMTRILKELANEG